MKVARPKVRLNECNVNDGFLSTVSTGLPGNKTENPASSGANVTQGDGSPCDLVTLATLTNNSRTKIILYTTTGIYSIDKASSTCSCSRITRSPRSVVEIVGYAPGFTRKHWAAIRAPI